jgi:hypothetical protein
MLVISRFMVIVAETSSIQTKEIMSVTVQQHQDDQLTHDYSKNLR